jgi:3',5'-cyclic AMP phosphodiesterase CpdA
VTLIAHISDLHFGTEDPVIVRALEAELADAAVVAVSGDLTQRARPREFLAARTFLDRLRGAKIVVPGNHDIPLYDVIRRFSQPLVRYRQFITDDLAPCYVGGGLAVAGVNTAHRFTFKDGKITEAQLAQVRIQLAPHPTAWKIVVAHHPFVLPAGAPRSDLVDNVDAAVRVFHDIDVDLILSGHLHVGYSADVAGFRDDDRQMIAVAAGTCMSTRLRGEPNAYNRLTFEGEQVTIVNRRWDGVKFVDTAAKVYRRGARQLVKVATVIREPARSPA